MTAWRLLEVEIYDAFMNMAIDEAILRARIQSVVPNTLRFYRWKPSAVSVGRFENIEKEVQLDNCRKHNVDVVRRITGGGTVYHDAQDEITYSVIARKEDLGAEEITAIYSRIYAGLAEALRILGIHADFNQGTAKACPNLTVNGKKISGSAQAHRSGAFLQHGTLLSEVNLERMFTFLRVPWAKTRMQIVSIAENRITSINDELGKTVSAAEVKDALVKGFEKALDSRLRSGELTAGELELSKHLCQEKYATDDWNLNGRTNEQKQEDFTRHVLY
ncbi:MAG: biotin/lipoate A/B protein ligase family protein [Candidatus Bathyarchaeia archaeon]